MAHHHHHRHEECVTLENPSIHSNNWWINDLHACSLPSWSTSNSTCWQTDQPKNNYNNNNNNINLSDDQSSGDDENVSISTSTFTNVSNHSDLSAESVRNNFVESGGGGGGAAGGGNEQFVGEAVVGSDHNDQHQLWNHLLLNVGCREELQYQDPAGLMFNPTCDNNNYSSSLTSFNNGVKNHHLINAIGENSIIHGPREPIIKSSSDMVDLINNWQIPNQDSTTTATTTISCSSNELLPPPPSRRGFGSATIKEEDYNNDHHMMMMMTTTRNNSLGSISSCFDHDIMKFQGAGDHHQEHGGNIMNDSSWCSSNGFDHQYSRMAAYSSSSSGSSNLDLNIRDSKRSSSRGFSSTADLMAANPSSSYINNNHNLQNRRPLMLDINLSKPFFKTLDLSAGCRKQGFRNSLYMKFPSPTSISKTPTKRNGRTQGNEGRKLLGSSSQDNSESISKKPKQETSAVLSSTKMQVPKVKLGDKITALQQIVSPFGKTDTASVLWEAIGYIRFLQEQIQLLSTPYLKGCASKELWGGIERKERGEGKGDLRTRGLCLVPISCTPQVYPADNAASDYLTPVYRGCLYR